MMIFPPTALAGLGSLAIYGAGAIGMSGALGGPDHPCMAIVLRKLQIIRSHFI